MHSLLEKIIAARKSDLSVLKQKTSLYEVTNRALSSDPPKYCFQKALEKKKGNAIHIIAEVKKASPSKGIICQDFNPVSIAKSYEESGASAISVLTEERFFQGSIAYLKRVVDSVSLPILRKDFIVDSYQIYETRYLGASAFLLIADCLEKAQLKEYIQLGITLGLTALVEVHRPNEIKKALQAGAQIIGINNRDLHTFATDLQVTLDLRPLIPEDILVISESGINYAADLVNLSRNNIQGVLIGEAFMREPKHIHKKMKELLAF